VVPLGPNPTPQGYKRHPEDFRGLVLRVLYTQALRDRNLPEEDIRVLNKINPDLLFDLRSAGEAFEDMKQMGLSGALPLGEVNPLNQKISKCTQIVRKSTI